MAAMMEISYGVSLCTAIKFTYNGMWMDIHRNMYIPLRAGLYGNAGQSKYDPIFP